MRRCLLMILLFTVMVSILISGCGSDVSSGSTEVSETADAASSDDDFSDEPTKGASASLSGQSDMLQNCLSIQDPMWMQMCAAAMNRDVKMCDDVKNSDMDEQKYHQSMCRAWVAGAAKDPSICRSFDEGKEFLQSDFTCYSYVARSARDDSYCSMLKTENGKKGCQYDTKVAKGTLKLSECKDTTCVFDYAWRNDDKSACDKFGDVTSAYLTTWKNSCLAMLSGDIKLCDAVKSEGVDNWSFCKDKANYKKMMPSPGVFDFSLCKKDDECFKTVMDLMILESAR